MNGQDNCGSYSARHVMTSKSSEGCINQPRHRNEIKPTTTKAISIQWLDAMDIPREDYSDWFKEGQYDAILVHSEKDAESAHCFKDFLMRIIDCKDEPLYPKICLLDSSATLSDDLQRVERLVDKSTHALLLITDNFFTDPFCQMLQDELIMTTICNGDERWKVIPVYPRRPINRIPLGIRAINALSLSRLIFSSSMVSTLPILNRDNVSQFDRYFVKQVQNIFDSKKTLRLKREDADLKRLELWISNEVEKRAWDSSKHLLHRINGTLNTRSLPQVVFFVKLYIYVCVCIALSLNDIVRALWFQKGRQVDSFSFSSQGLAS